MTELASVAESLSISCCLCQLRALLSVGGGALVYLSIISVCPRPRCLEYRDVVGELQGLGNVDLERHN